jgi:hypothetical protein
MPVIPILLSDTAQAVEYKVALLGRAAAQDTEHAKLKRRRDYYAGDHALLLSDDQLAFLKGVIDPEEDGWPIDNKARAVVDKVRSRLSVVGFRDADGNRRTFEQAEGEPGDEQDAAPLDPNATDPVSRAVTWWTDNDLDRFEGELYKAALRDGEAFILTDVSAGGMIRYTLAEAWDGTSGVRMVYEDTQTRLKPVMAVKYWYTMDPMGADGANVARCTVYTASAIYKYARLVSKAQQGLYAPRIPKGEKTTEDGWTPITDEGDVTWPLPWLDTTGQPLGLAVTRFVSPRGSLVDPIIGLNNALNKANLDMLAVGDQQGFGLITVKYDNLPPLATNDDPTTAADGLGLRPGRAHVVGGQLGHVARRLQRAPWSQPQPVRRRRRVVVRGEGWQVVVLHGDEAKPLLIADGEHIQVGLVQRVVQAEAAKYLRCNKSRATRSIGIR